MQLIFILCATAGLLYVLWAKRTFDLFATAYIASCVYFLPGFVGYLPDGPRKDIAIDIHSETYCVMLVVLMSILAGAVWKDLYQRKAPAVTRHVANPLLPRIALGIAIVGFLITVRISGAALLSPYKHVVMETLTRWYILWVFAASLAAVTAFLQKQWYAFAAAWFLLLANVYVGFRAPSALTIIAICILHLSSKGPRRLVSGNKRPVLFGGAAAVVFFVYKKIYRMVKLGEYEIVSESLLDPQFYMKSLLESEPFTTQSILNSIVSSDFYTGWDHLVKGVLLQCIPLLKIQRSSFNDLFQNTLYRDQETGMAANIWAEMISVAGWPLFLSFIALFVLSLGAGERLLRIPRLFTRGAAALGLSYWVFYIHRNELSYQLNLEKRVLVVWVLCVVISMVITGGSRSAPSRDVALRRRLA